MTALALTVFEGVLRARPWDVLIYRDSLSPDIRFEPIPLAHGFLERARVQLNSRGLRDREHSSDKPPSVKQRVLVLGDSMTFGRGVPEEATFVKQWEKRLGPSCEVINGAVCAYDGEQALSFFEARLADLKPDVVLLVISPDDLEDTPPILLNRHPRLKNFLREHFVLMRYLMEQSYKNRFPKPGGSSPGLAHAAAFPAASRSRPRPLGSRGRKTVLPEEDDSTVGEAPVKIRDSILKRTRLLLERAKSLSETKGFRLLLLYLPRLDRLSTDLVDPERHAAVQRVSRELGLTLWDAFPALSSLPPTELLLSSENPYLSEKGHALVARYLTEKSETGGIFRGNS